MCTIKKMVKHKTSCYIKNLSFFSELLPKTTNSTSLPQPIHNPTTLPAIVNGSIFSNTELNVDSSAANYVDSKLKHSTRLIGEHR